jgi:uncharacterized membrane protein (UPF0127 family)
MNVNLCHPERSEGSLKEQPVMDCCFVEILRLCLRMTAGLFLFSGACHADASGPQVCHPGNCVTVEVVSKQDEMERGLMYRTRLDQNKGMLFVFTHDDKFSFWMKNMRFNLDILWINLEGRIVFIGRDVPACSKGSCPVYIPDKEARFVLELNSGYAASHHWKVGDKLDLNHLLGL